MAADLFLTLLALLGGFLASLGAALVFIPAICRIAHERGWIDAPDGHRKLHHKPIPNVGGLAIVAATFVGLSITGLAGAALDVDAVGALMPSAMVMAGAVLIALVGFWDDLRDMHFRPKFVAQILASGFVVAAGFRIDLLDSVLGGGTLAFAVSVLMTIVWMVGIMNAVNMLDGMDGLAAGVVAIAFLGLAGTHLVGGNDIASIALVLTIVAALFGFLRYNFSPASVFMGDSGSLFLGYLLAAYALTGTGHSHSVLALIVPAVAMGLPILDTGTSIARRLVKRRSLFRPDRDHIHHRMSGRMATRHAVLTLYTLGGFFAGGAVLMASARPRTAVWIFVAGSLVVMMFLYRLGYLPARRTLHASGDAPHSPSLGSPGGDGAAHEPPAIGHNRGSGGPGHSKMHPVSSPER